MSCTYTATENCAPVHIILSTCGTRVSVPTFSSTLGTSLGMVCRHFWVGSLELLHSDEKITSYQIDMIFSLITPCAHARARGYVRIDVREQGVTVDFQLQRFAGFLHQTIMKRHAHAC